MRKKIIIFLMMIVGMGLLSGCYKLEGDATIDGTTNTVSGTILLAFPKQLAPPAPKPGELPEGVTTAPYEEGDLVGFTYTLTNVAVSEFGDATTMPITLTRTASGYELVGDFTKFPTDAQSLEQQGNKIEGELPDPVLNLQITFPGPITTIEPGMESSVNQSTLTLTTDVVKLHPTFKFASPLSSTGEPNADDRLGPAFGETPFDDPRVGVYPIPLTPRNMLPIYIFTVMVVGGLALSLYGHFGRLPAFMSSNGGHTESKKSKKKKPTKKETKPRKPKKPAKPKKAPKQKKKK